jgi:hypothetical protein
MRLFPVFFVLFISFFLSLHSATAQYNNWAFGFRIGEPSGVNVRKYFGDNHAFDLNIGTFGGLYGTTREYGNGQYRSIGLTIQGHYLWHDRIFGNDNFRGYYGFGGQINNRRSYPTRLNGDYESTLSLGGSGIAGAEYFIPNKQYSVFVELGIYAEVLPVPLFLNVSSGLGVRFNL